MAFSPEYPDLPFALPAAYGRGRDGKAVRYIVVHFTAGSETRTSAEDGAAYDRSRTDGTSTHYFVDQDSVFQEVLTGDRANAAFGKGNRLGIQYELCGTAQTRAQWLDPASDATLTNAARQMARDAARYGIPVRRLSVAEVRACWYSFPAGPKGFCGHADVTLAYPEDGGDHMDPGPDFPWDVPLDRVQQFVGGRQPTATIQGGNMPFRVQLGGTQYLSDGTEYVAAPDYPTTQRWDAAGIPKPVPVANATELAYTAGQPAGADVAALRADVAAVKTTLATLVAAGGSADSAAIIAHMDQLAAAETARDQAHAAEVADLRAALAAAQRAAADKLAG